MLPAAKASGMSSTKTMDNMMPPAKPRTVPSTPSLASHDRGDDPSRTSAQDANCQANHANGKRIQFIHSYLPGVSLCLAGAKAPSRRSPALNYGSRRSHAQLLPKPHQLLATPELTLIPSGPG